MKKIIEFVLDKKKYFIGLVVLITVGIIGFVILSSKNIVEANEIEELAEENISQENIDEEVDNTCFVKVDIKGQVANPGLYEIECNARVNDVIIKAGGLAKDADTSSINLSKIVFDQMVIVVDNKIKEEPKIVEKIVVQNDACVCNDSSEKVQQAPTPTPTPSPKNNSNCSMVCTDEKNTGNKISLNKATKEELMNLTGVGEAKAIAIIKYREDNNGFKKLEEIMNISGIGEKAFEKIKDSITL